MAGIEGPDVMILRSHCRVDPAHPLDSWQLSLSLSSQFSRSCSGGERHNTLVSTSTAPASCPSTVLAQSWANGQNGFKKGRGGVCLEIEKCLTRPQETAALRASPFPHPLLPWKERKCGSWKWQQAMSCCLTCTQVQTRAHHSSTPSSSHPARGW